MKKWIGYIALAIGAIIIFSLSGGIGKFAGRTAVQEYQKGKGESVVAGAQKIAAEELRAQLPMRVNELTILQSVVSIGTLLMYNYTVDANRSEIDLKEFMSTMRSNIKTNVCSHKSMVEAIKYGGRYKYSYVGSDGIYIGDIEIGKKECGIN